MTIKVLVKEPYKEPEIKEIEDTLKNWQKLVEGYIQCVPAPFDDDIQIVCNEEGKIKSMDGNFFLPEYDDVICGTVGFVTFNKDGEFASITDKQMEKAKNYIKNYQLNVGEDLYAHHDILSVRAKLLMKHLNETMQ